MLRSLRIGAVALLTLLPACWHATIETGLPASGDVIEQSFASSWIIGLVPPKLVSATSKCHNGVAKVETQLSFVNQLVAFLTLDIYTPMTIKVTCASGGRASIPSGADVQVGGNGNPTEEQVIEAFQRAADQAVETGKPVYVTF